MNFAVLSVLMFVLFSGSLFSSVSGEKEKVKPVSSKIQYVGEEADQPGGNIAYGGSPDMTSYGGLPNGYGGLSSSHGNLPNSYGGQPGSYGGQPNSYGGFVPSREILRNRFRGSNSGSQDESKKDESSRNDRGSSGNDGQDEIANRSLYPDNEEQDETPNGVFSNPFEGQNRRIFNFLPPLFSSIGNSGNGVFPSLLSNRGNTGVQPNMFSGFGNNGNGAQPAYGGQYPAVGAYDPNFRIQPGFYPYVPVFRPGVDPGYMYQSGGSGGNGLGQRQPNGAYGPGYGNVYGTYPGMLRNYQPRFPPSDGMNGSYRGNPPRTTYGPPPFGSDRYPDSVYPGQGYEYGKYKDSKSNGDKYDEDYGRKGSPYSHSTSSYSSPSKRERTKDYDGYRGKDYDGSRGRDNDGRYREREYP